jgi:hypothetical protein
MELFLNISNLALILKALIIKRFPIFNIKKLKKYWTVFKHFQFGPNIKSQF